MDTWERSPKDGGKRSKYEGHGTIICSRPNNVNRQCVCSFSQDTTLYNIVLILYLTACETLPSLTLLTALNSSWDGGQVRRSGLVFVVSQNVNPSWEKSKWVIMRHPPSAGCLLGQTGCLTAQAVDRILMDMTNYTRSLSPYNFSRYHFSSARRKLSSLNSLIPNPLFMYCISPDDIILCTCLRVFGNT